jgi:hypothetical protein
MSAGSPDSAAQRNGPFPSQNSGREARVREGVVVAGGLGLGPEGVAVVEDLDAPPGERHQAGAVAHHRLAAAGEVGIGVPPAEVGGGVHVEPHGHIRQRIVRRGLVGHDVDELDEGGVGGQSRHHLGGVVAHADGERLAGGLGGSGQRPGLTHVGGHAVEVAVLAAALYPVGIDVDADGHAPVHGHGQRLRAAHPAKPRSEGDRAPQ